MPAAPSLRATATDAARPSPASLWPCVVVCAALAAVVVASRLWLADAFGSALPFMDEWDIEAVGLYRPWLDGTFRWTDLFRAHNEHHLFLTRVVDLGFFIAYGRWEPWAQIVLNALLHAAAAAALAAIFWPALEPRARSGFIAGLAVLFTATCGWQNALLGIQSQVYFSSLFAIIALAGITLREPWTRGWWLGWSTAVAALFCFAGGVLAAMSALAATAFLPAPAQRTKRDWAAHALLGAVIVAGLLLFVEPPGQKPLHAQTLAQFYAVFARCLSWPYVDSPLPWLLLQLPIAVLVVLRWRRREPLPPLERCALGLAIFAALQAAAVAHNRGNGLIEARPLSRYQDPLLLGAAAQWFAALRLASTCGRNARLLALAWAGATAIGVLLLTTTNLSFNLSFKRAEDAASLEQVRTYLKTHDATVFTANPAHLGPHPNPQVVQNVLDDPVLRPVLPAVFFSNEPESAPGMKPWLITHGRTFFALALAALASALFWAQRRESDGANAAVAAQPRAP